MWSPDSTHNYSVEIRELPPGADPKFENFALIPAGGTLKEGATYLLVAKYWGADVGFLGASYQGVGLVSATATAPTAAFSDLVGEARVSVTSEDVGAARVWRALFTCPVIAGTPDVKVALLGLAQGSRIARTIRGFVTAGTYHTA
jgi:hypothetical protein